MTFPPDFQTLYNFFLEQEEEILETSLLKEFFPEKNYASEGITLDLFEKHFLLYRRLYIFSDELYGTPYRLQISNIRIRFFRTRDLYDDTNANGGIDGSRILSDSESSLPIHDTSLRSYYMDLKNLDAMTEERLQKLTEGFYLKAFYPEQIEEAKKTLGIEEPFDHDTIRQKFRELSKKHHPDRNDDQGKVNTELFIKTRNAYEILTSCNIPPTDR